MLHNAPSSDLSSIILFWKKSRKIDHVSWIDTKLIWNLIFSYFQLFKNEKNLVKRVSILALKLTAKILSDIYSSNGKIIPNLVLSF